MASIYDWSKTAASNSNADSGINWAEGMDPGAVNDSARQEMARVAEFRDDIAGTLTAGGSANALTVTANSNFTTLANGRLVAFMAASDNTNAATLNVNGIGAKSIRKMDATGDVALVGGEIQAGGVYFVVYNTALNGAAGGWMLVNPTLTNVSGSYTPSTTNVSNAAAVGNPSRYTRIGNSGVVHGSVSVTCTSSGTATFGLSLPVASDLTASADLNGLAIASKSSDGTGTLRWLVQADTTNNRAQITTAAAAASTTYDLQFSFQYVIQ